MSQFLLFDTLLSLMTSSESQGNAALIIFLVVFIAISFHLLHETAAVLIGAVVVFLVTYIGGTFNPNLHILTFEDAMMFVDWNVIFLILGMMIFMAILSETNVFRWLGFQLYILAGGNTWLIVLLLVLLTAFTAAFLNNVTAILLIVPLSIQLSIALGLNPVIVVIAEVLASNIGGAATLIGNPPSTIVGSHIGLSFGEYMVNMAPVAVICMVVLILYIRFRYRKEFSGDKREISPALVEMLETESKIKDYPTLYKALLLGAITFILFFAAENFSSMPPSVVALSGAAFLIAWVRPDMDRMMREVD
jgi:Na+/H+ antiporter NhaD/arsenite permease-like protein